MDLVNRLKHYMDISQVTISQFADRCGIPRPTMSQLMNGRNKRISDEVINKIHNAFPDLSILWLMFGEGEMVTRRNIEISEPQNSAPNGQTPQQPNTNQAVETTIGTTAAFTDSAPTSNSFEDLLFESSQIESPQPPRTEEEDQTRENILFETPSQPFANTQTSTYDIQHHTAHPDQQARLQNDVTRTLAAASHQQATSQDVGREEVKHISISPDAHKKITNIVVFYSDNSFQSFLPDA